MSYEFCPHEERIDDDGSVDCVPCLKASLAAAKREQEEMRELIKEMADHEGAEGFSAGMDERIKAALNNNKGLN